MESLLVYPVHRPSIAQVFELTSLTIANQVGTGGFPTVDYWSERGDTGYRTARFAVSARLPHHGVRLASDDLASIRAVFKPSVTDLARLLGVSRQAVYDWQHGKPIAVANASRLAALADAASVFSYGGISVSASALRRSLSGGKSLLDMAGNGERVVDAAHQLIHILRQEAEQRNKLTARLGSRKRSSASVSDYGAPILDETA